MMQAVTNPRHESAQQSPLPTVDHVAMFGHGTLQHKDTGAGLVERSLTVQKTNPSMKNGYGPAVREEKQRITSRAMDVYARSGNQSPAEIDERVDPAFIWGQVGEGDEVQSRFTTTHLLVLAGIGLGAFLLFKRK
jgi:hypothetical protein